MALDGQTIDGGGVRLRRYRAQDAPALHAAGVDPQSRAYLPAPEDLPVLAGSGAIADGGRFAVTDPATDRLLGGIDLVHHGDGEGRMGFWVAPPYRRRRIATAAVRTLTAHALAAGFDRIQLYTDFANVAAQRVALTVGFLREGVARAALPGRRGGRHDAIMWSRVPDDPPGPTPRFLPDLDGGMLSDGVVLLLPIAAEDAAELHPVRASPDVVEYTVTRRAPSAAETVEYCARSAAAWLEDRSVRLVVRDWATGRFVGKVGLSVEDAEIGQAEIDYYLAPQWRGRGYATRAVRLLCDWAFRHTGLVRLVAGVHPPNVASQRVLARAGFAREGCERARLPDGAGGRTDVYTYVLLRS